MIDPAILEAARAAGGPIEQIGANLMLDQETFDRSTANGYPHPFAGYFVGRGGVLGDAPTEVVDAVFQVFAPEVVKMFWEQGVSVHGARRGADLYAEQIHEWGRDHLKNAPGLERLVELGEKVISATPGNGLPLFAGWKAMPLPDDVPARAMQILITLRELRGSIHLAAVTAAGLTPTESHLLNKGAEYCAFFGWPEPFPAVEHLKDKRQEVEDLTNERVAAVWGAVLTADEARELAEVSAAALAASTG